MMFAHHRQSPREAWDRFWFEDSPTTMLDIARIGIGSAMLINYSLATPFLLLFWGDDGLISRTQILEDLESWTHSVHFYFTAPWQWMAFHAVFLLSCAAFAAGWRTSWVKWIVLIGQTSYASRNPVLAYGVDQILASLLLILCVAPVGRALSLDRVRAVRAAKHADLAAALPRYSSPWAGACTRLMQIQMAVLFLYSGIGKIRGDEWWDGDAVWQIFVTHEYYHPLMLQILAHHYWLGNIATYATILIEVAFPFVIWPTRTRPYALAGAIFLHVQFALLMGLFYFSFVMIMGHMSFLRPIWLDRLGTIWKRRMGDMEMIYDGRCGFCVRSMAWFLAFDGLGQVTTRDFRAAPSPIVSDAQLEKALYLILPDGRALPGFEAYRFVVLRVPGMWWMIPFFYLPVFSRLVGRPIYRWVAGNRNWWGPPMRTAEASD
jgi:predicted DCC family thiol-disulfide oxidoreductase YuxK